MAWRIAHDLAYVAVPVSTTSSNCRRRIAKATGGQVVMALADMDGNETFEASNLGTAEEVGLLLSDLAAFGLCVACHFIPASSVKLCFWGGCQIRAAQAYCCKLYSYQDIVFSIELAAARRVCFNAGGGGDGG